MPAYATNANTETGHTDRPPQGLRAPGSKCARLRTRFVSVVFECPQIAVQFFAAGEVPITPFRSI